MCHVILWCENEILFIPIAIVRWELFVIASIINKTEKIFFSFYIMLAVYISIEGNNYIKVEWNTMHWPNYFNLGDKINLEIFSKKQFIYFSLQGIVHIVKHTYKVYCTHFKISPSHLSIFNFKWYVKYLISRIFRLSNHVPLFGFEKIQWKLWVEIIPPTSPPSPCRRLFQVLLD